MKKKYKIGLAVILVLIGSILLIGIGKIFLKEEEEQVKNTTNVISNIEKYGYTLDDRDTQYMKDIFQELENILNEEEIKEEEYAKCLAKLFVIDFYTLNNKINKYDVGSLEYILSDKIEDFKTKAMDTMYNDIIDNTYLDRVQDLPEIINVEIETLEETTFKLKEEEKECYKIEMTYTYKEDLGYDEKGTIYLVKGDTKLEVVLYEPKIEN